MKMVCLNCDQCLDSDLGRILFLPSCMFKIYTFCLCAVYDCLWILYTHPCHIFFSSQHGLPAGWVRSPRHRRYRPAVQILRPGLSAPPAASQQLCGDHGQQCGKHVPTALATSCGRSRGGLRASGQAHWLDVRTARMHEARAFVHREDGGDRGEESAERGLADSIWVHHRVGMAGKRSTRSRLQWQAKERDCGGQEGEGAEGNGHQASQEARSWEHY